MYYRYYWWGGIPHGREDILKAVGIRVKIAMVGKWSSVRRFQSLNSLKLPRKIVLLIRRLQEWRQEYKLQICRREEYVLCHPHASIFIFFDEAES